jgi:hypothetical protein
MMNLLHGERRGLQVEVRDVRLQRHGESRRRRPAVGLLHAGLATGYEPGHEDGHVAKRVTRPIRNREASAPESHLGWQP